MKISPVNRKKSSTIIIVAFTILLISLTGCTNNTEKQPITTENPLVKIRVGWQIPWATQGQLVQVMKHNNISEKFGLAPEYIGFSYGGPLNEAALAGDVDIIFTADQPAATLISKSDNWVIIGRLMYNRVSLYVPPHSPIQNISDLRGKTVAMPFGAAAQRMALQAEINAGLNPQKDVNNINLGIYEQTSLVHDDKAEKWGTIDAMAGFDPTPAIFEEKGLIRNLHTENVVSVIVMSKQYIAKNPEAPIKFLQAFRDSYDFYRTNQDTANQWFVQESKLNITSEALQISASVEPNIFVTNKSSIRIGFNDKDYVIMQEAADFLYNNKMINKPVNMSEHVDLRYLKELK